MKPSLHEIPIEEGIFRMLDDPVAGMQVTRTMAGGDLRELPALLEPFGMHPLPRELCIPVTRVIRGMHPVGYRVEVVWHRYFSDPSMPHAFSIVLTQEQIDKLKGHILPAMPPSTPKSCWDLLLAKGLLRSEFRRVPEYARIDETRQMEICKVMYGNPKADKG